MMWYVGDSSSLLIAMANKPPVRKYVIMPNRYWMPTTLWSRVYLKYFARPPAGACSTSGSGWPAISRSRSLKTPSPASQPTVPNTYPRTTGQSLTSLRPCAKLALADATCKPSQLPMNQPITAPIKPVCTAGLRHQALTSAGPPGSPPTGWIRSAPGVASMAIRSPLHSRNGQCVRRRQRPGAHHGETKSPGSPDWDREGVQYPLAPVMPATFTRSRPSCGTTVGLYVSAYGGRARRIPIRASLACMDLAQTLNTAGVTTWPESNMAPCQSPHSSLQRTVKPPSSWGLAYATLSTPGLASAFTPSW